MEVPTDDLVMIVCGGRDYNDHKKVHATLERFKDHCDRLLIVHGGQTGADSLAKWWVINQRIDERIAADLGVESWADQKEFLADWKQHGDLAGPIRNHQMLKYLMTHPYKRKGVLAFPGGSGTANMCEIAEEQLVKVMRIT